MDAGRKRGPRPISAKSSLEGRQLWRIGDWGSASEHIGRRWEELGARELEGLLGEPRPGPGREQYVPRSAVVVSADPELAQAVHRGGKPHADAILVGVAAGQTVLEPVDFKWTLETAEPRQVGAEVLESLLTEPPALLQERLRQALAEATCPDDGELLFHPGIFLAPDYAANRGQLAPMGPLPPEMAVLRSVDPLAFFAPLPGWEVARALADADRAALARIEVVERYYRLGAGVLGALRRLRTGIFTEQLVELDGVAELVALRQRRRLQSAGELVAHLDRSLRAHREKAERLRLFEQNVHPFWATKKALERRKGGPQEDKRAGRLHGEVMAAVRTEVRHQGRLLIERGQSEQDALHALETMVPTFSELARTELALRLKRL